MVVPNPNLAVSAVVVADEVFSCIINFTRSMGATIVLAIPPAHAPAMASLADENDLEEDSADTADDDGAPTPTADVWFMSMPYSIPSSFVFVKLRTTSAERPPKRSRQSLLYGRSVVASSSSHFAVVKT